MIYNGLICNHYHCLIKREVFVFSNVFLLNFFSRIFRIFGCLFLSCFSKCFANFIKMFVLFSPIFYFFFVGDYLTDLETVNRERSKERPLLEKKWTWAGRGDQSGKSTRPHWPIRARLFDSFNQSSKSEVIFTLFSHFFMFFFLYFHPPE